MRRMTVNVGLIIFFVIFSIFLYNAGKGYNLLIDNKAITMDGKDLAPYPWVRVNISTARKPVFLKAGGRDVLFVVGKSHTIHVEIMDEKKNVVKEIEKKFKLTRQSGDFLSIPALGEDMPQWIQKRS
ncbi:MULTISPECIES: DUF6672 family protein [Aminobacterium]|jgi:hypothetical protein|uniref:Uncharacterized protein n=2 Tax=Aminobacteriaceae TaxID=3029087 RepID=D5ED72_AMICL|nr:MULTISPECIES: DUF6672 family protein [Aminobacterium]MDD2378757.1 hypothetical protein [Aminobacterium colombiense]ADE56504.1 hypothetical protein Amico_0361 [Aminobacterium colombiense DSM 12261]MDD3767474.1 hypothetical protein [Aminobacterium colombiense]MDD4265174.1 hypothetical protein [Aminobacterium colombiense]MDD4585380.1 hypothetical protein [Aminobacterium colombiense]